MTDLLSRLQAAVADRYRLVREIGKGGMATVYLADDLRHRRPVAIKLLTPELGAIIGGERFLAEIQVTANLQHPHILGLIDSGAADGLLFYVMPYVEGETLRGRLERERQLSVSEALRITREVGSALDYAHRQGVIHRDIKPENVLLPDGQAMVADFGIARAAGRAGGSRLTETGMSLGTPSYMSPEQAGGEHDVDGRSDQYSLACLLYEMLAGQPPHSALTVQALLAAVLTREPEALDALRSTVPAHVADAVHIALAKLPADRFESTAKFLTALEQPGSGSSASVRRATADRGASSRAKATRSAVVAGVAIGGLALGAAGSWLGRSAGPSSPPPRYQFTIEGDKSHALGELIALSPDGRTLVYWAATEGNRIALYARAMDSLQPRVLTTFDATGDNQDAGVIFFSPDGREVGFVTAHALRRVSLDGGQAMPVVSLLDVIVIGATWTDASEIICSPNGVLMRVPAGGGALTRVSRHGADSAAVMHSPAALPGGKRVLAVRDVGASAEIGILTLSTGEFHATTRGLTPAYVAPGHLVFGRLDGSVWSQPFDLRSGDTTGVATRIGQGAIQRFGYWTQTAASQTGVVSWATSQATEALLQLSDKGAVPRTLLQQHGLFAPRLSPTGKQIVFTKIRDRSALTDLWMYDVASGTERRLTLNGLEQRRDFNDAEWSHDGRWIALSGNDSTGLLDKHVYVMPADGGTQPRKLLSREGDQWPSDFSPDGKWLVFTDGTPDGLRSIWVTPVDGSSPPRALVKTPHSAMGGRLSPDGKWLAYQADDTGQNEVYVQPFPGPGAPVRISTAGGRMPVWSRAGSELYYATAKALEIATVSARAAFTVTARRPSLAISLPVLSLHAQYDVSADGKQIVLLTAPIAPTTIVISTGVSGIVAK